MKYEYTLGDNLEEPLKYSYTIYQGEDFVYCWFLNRQSILSIIGKEGEYQNLCIDCYSVQDLALSESKEMSEPKIHTKAIFHEMMRAFLTYKSISEKLRKQLDGFVKTFEVRKRLYPAYSIRFKPEDENSYHDITLYIMFACVCALAFDRYQDFRYLNALLKVNDTVISQWEREPALKGKENRQLVAYALQMELKFIMEICNRKGIGLWRLKSENT